MAVDDVSISVSKDEIVCLVGESGSGKTTLAKIMAGLIFPTSGEVFFEKSPLSSMDGRALLSFRRRVQYIPQFPDLALDPTWYVYDSIAEPLRIHRLVRTKDEELSVVLDHSSRFGLCIDQLRRKPRDLSGGEVQRAVIARALTLSPDLLVADEPTSMLDPSTQAKILRQIMEVRTESGFALVLVTHDLNLAKIVSGRVCVMLGGKIIESGKTDEIFSAPIHPYTFSLVTGAVFDGNEDGRAACPYYGYCEESADLCKVSFPPKVWFGKGRFARCWRVG